MDDKGKNFSSCAICHAPIKVEIYWSLPLRMELTEAAFLLKVVFAYQG
jgi:hypothetical protein